MPRALSHTEIGLLRKSWLSRLRSSNNFNKYGVLQNDIHVRYYVSKTTIFGYSFIWLDNNVIDFFWIRYSESRKPYTEIKDGPTTLIKCHFSSSVVNKSLLPDWRQTPFSSILTITRTSGDYSQLPITSHYLTSKILLREKAWIVLSKCIFSYKDLLHVKFSFVRNYFFLGSCYLTLPMSVGWLDGQTVCNNFF